MRAYILLVAALAACLLGCMPARADDSSLCRGAIAAAERDRRIPDSFLSAIARVESGRPGKATGTLEPWPWTVDAEGHGAFFETRAAAMDAVRALQARGVRSIDVGCLQVNLMQHPEAFASLDQAFDPQENARFAAGLLISLFQQTGSWPLAAAAYHSQTPSIGAPYQKRVLAEWAVPDGAGDAAYAASADSPRPRHRPPAATPASSEWLVTQPQPRPAIAAEAAAPAAARPMAASGSVFAMSSPAARTIGFASRAAPGSVGLPSTGRTLAAYRMMPTRLAFRLPLKPR